MQLPAWHAAVEEVHGHLSFRAGRHSRHAGTSPQPPEPSATPDNQSMPPGALSCPGPGNAHSRT